MICQLHKISLNNLSQWWSHSKVEKPSKDDEVYLVNLDWNLINNGKHMDVDEPMGLPGNIAQDVSFNVACGWGGWGFYTLNDSEKGTVINSIPVLLLEDKYDAFVFRLKYPGASWSPTISTDKEEYNVKYS